MNGQKANVRANVKAIAVTVFCLVQSHVVLFSVRRFLLNLSGAKISSTATIHRNITFYSFGKLVVGELSTVNSGCVIDNRAPIFIGRNVNISHNVRIYTGGHDINSPGATMTIAPVTIQDNAWVFPNVIIQPGVVIAEGAVIYPGSVVTKNVGAYEIWGGNPAKCIKHRSRTISYEARFPIWFGI